MTIGRPSIPIEVQESYRRVHRSHAEKAEKAEMGVKVDLDIAEPPKYMRSKAKRQKFTELATMLREVSEQLCTSLDTDALAAYVDAQSNYEFNQKRVDALHAKGASVDLDELATAERLRNNAQDKADKLRSVLMLEPASRAHAVLPKPEEKPVNRFAEFSDGE